MLLFGADSFSSVSSSILRIRRVGWICNNDGEND